MDLRDKKGKCCCCSVAQSCPTLCNHMNCSTPGFPVLRYLLGFAHTHVHWTDDAIQPSHALTAFSSCLQSFPAAGSFPLSQLFASGGQKCGSFSSSISPSNQSSWLISFGLTGLISLLSKGLFRVFSSTEFKALILRYSAFFMVQLSHPDMTTGKTIDLIRWTLLVK